MGETLRQRWGPLPVWGWAIIFVAVLGFYMYRKNKAAQAAAAAQANAQGVNSNATNLNVPVSNLTTAAQPMPIQLGDTFINTGAGGGISSPNGQPNTTLIGNVNPGGTMIPAGPPQPSAATQVG
jgi:hypothetical protein